jgi:hypothetical protein
MAKPRFGGASLFALPPWQCLIYHKWKRLPDPALSSSDRPPAVDKFVDIREVQ